MIIVTIFVFFALHKSVIFLKEWIFHNNWNNSFSINPSSINKDNQNENEKE